MNRNSKSASGHIAAFFDLDGTLIPSPSLEWRFASHLLARDEISRSTLARWLLRCLKDCLRAPWGIARANKSHLAGLRTSLVEDWERSLEPTTIESTALPMFAACALRIRSHLDARHTVVFITGTLHPLAQVVARRFASDCQRSAAVDTAAAANQIEICATRLETLGDYWTGFLASDHMSGEAKARAVRDLAARRGFDLARSFAYGDEIADLPMLASVGHPVAVNPSSRLARAACQRGWPTCEWRALETSAFAHPSQTPYTNAAPRIQCSHAPRFSPRPTL
jgi:alcohol-forming fatty acyl-CoA reductase